MDTFFIPSCCVCQLVRNRDEPDPTFSEPSTPLADGPDEMAASEPWPARLQTPATTTASGQLMSLQSGQANSASEEEEESVEPSGAESAPAVDSLAAAADAAEEDQEEARGAQVGAQVDRPSNRERPSELDGASEASSSFHSGGGGGGGIISE